MPGPQVSVLASRRSQQEEIPFATIDCCSSQGELPLMSDRNRIWRALVLVVLIVAVLVTTMGMVWHYHHDRSAADQCTLCHLVIAPTVTVAGVCQLAFASAEYVVQSEFFISRWVIGQIPSRAPPR